jgi:hypothetical protein
MIFNIYWRADPIPKTVATKKEKETAIVGLSLEVPAAAATPWI